MNDFIELMIYPIEKILILLQNLKIANISLYNILAGAIILSLIFSLFFSVLPGLMGSSSSRSHGSGSNDSGSDNKSGE